MTATLQERLNYLVNYSSQLIFVSGNSLADQTQALEETLFQQSENTELAYLVADDSFEITDYRRLLCQQLLGQSGTLSRPLNECLASLNHHEGPVMIAITRAEKMPNNVLQELWELVLQSRFAGNKQHLNVILFGETKWATQAKKWLPANNSGTPLLLSSQQTSFTPQRGLQPSRPTPNSMVPSEPHEIEQRPIISMGAFWAATILVFLCVLVGITVWLYGEQASKLFTPLGSEPEIIEARDGIQLPKEPATIETVMQWQSVEQATPNSTVDSEIIEKPISDTTVENDQSAESLVLEEIAESEQAIAEQPLAVDVVKEKPVNKIADTGFYIQIAGLKDGSLLSRFVKDNKLEDTTITYQTQRYGGPWHVVIMATNYSTLVEAREAISQLPNFQNRDQAFVKRADVIVKELSLAPAQDTLDQ